MATFTPEAGIVEMKRRLASLATIPQRVVADAHQQIIAGIPVYTGTYKRAVQFELAPDGSMAAVYVDEASLKAASSVMVSGDLFGDDPSKRLDYIYKNVHGKDPEGPYVLRIEQHGRPTDHQPSGMDLWLMAWRDSYVMFIELIEKAARGLL